MHGKYVPLKFQVGSGAPLVVWRNFQGARAFAPLINPLLMRMPGKANLDWVISLMAASVESSWSPNSLLGKARMTSSSPNCSESAANDAYSLFVAPHLHATFTA